MLPDNVMEKQPSERRLVHVYTGNGKGKTSAAVGMIVRALGRGWKVFMIQFMKSESCSGETTVLRQHPNFKCVQSGTRDFVRKSHIRPADRKLAKIGFAEAQKSIEGQNYDMVVLDEVIQAVEFGLIPLEKILHLIRQKPDQTELVLTGRNAPVQIIESADLVSEIVEVSHPFQKGVQARKGVEF